MQPLNPRVRVAYLFLFIALFAGLLPIVIGYAEGWRFSSDIGLYKTGGLYVTVPYADVTVTLDGDLVGTTGLFRRSFYVDDLAPAAYVVRAGRGDRFPWERVIVVEPQLVTEARVLLLPLAAEKTQLVLSGNATGTRIVSSQIYTSYRAAFATPVAASSSLPVTTQNGVGLFLVNGDLVARLVESDRPIPSHFCFRPSLCATDIPVERGDETVVAAAFFDDGVLYTTHESGVFFTEVDVRPTSRTIPVYAQPGAEFRIIEGGLVVKEGSNYYEITL